MSAGLLQSILDSPAVQQAATGLVLVVLTTAGAWIGSWLHARYPRAAATLDRLEPVLQPALKAAEPAFEQLVAQVGHEGIATLLARSARAHGAAAALAATGASAPAAAAATTTATTSTTTTSTTTGAP